MAERHINTDSGQSDGGENNIQVFVRIRPPGPDEAAYTRVVDVDPSHSQVIVRQQPNPRVFSFDYVADIDSKQETIFNTLGKKVIENCVAGYNGTIFAYGQTGSGKTFTMMGPSEDSDNFHNELRGVIPRSFEYLYNLVAREKELHGDSKQFLCKCSFLEIYNEQIFDLLEPSSNCLHLRESLKTGVYVSGLSEQVVADACEAYEVLTSSWMNRKVASTSMNRESSRSHAVFTLQIESKETKGGLDNIKTSALNLVDLAGSERQKDTGATGVRLKEAGSINKSLSNLGNVIMALVSVSRDGKKRYIPYRDSKLTFLLRDSLGGNAKTSLIACVHPGHKCFGETLSTLLFAKRAKMIKNKAILNENSLGNIRHLQAEIKSLREELAMYKMGNIPLEPSIAPAESMPILREMFLQAMMLRQLAESEKQDLYASIDGLRELIEKKDKAIQTNKMIIKFRDNNIKRLEGKLAGADIIDTKQEDLQKEIDVLRTQIEHHPLVAKHSSEVQRLKMTIRSLREDSGVVASIGNDKEKVRLLEEEYHRLVAEQDGKDEKQITPQRADVVSTATIEKMRSQVSDLTSQVEQLKEELCSCQQAAEKSELLKNGEIDSFKKYVAELEMVLSANNMRSNLERAAMTELHRQTVITITTPKKECYRLRNRTVVSSTGTPDLDTSIPFETEVSPAVETQPAEEGILAENVPEEVALQAQEALLDQIKQLEEKNASLETRLSEYETDRIKQLHQQTVLESKLKSLEELLEKEQLLVSTLREEQNQVEPKLKKANEEKESAIGETQDLRLLLKQADKELKEKKEKLKTLDAEKNKIIENFESKCGEFALMVEKMEKDKYKLEEDIEMLEFSLEAEKGNKEFQEDLALKFEVKNIEQAETIKKLEQDLQNAELTIIEEKDLRESMVDQLSCMGQETEQEMVKKCEENQHLMKENISLKNTLDAHENSAAILRKVVVEKDSKIFNLENNLKHMEEKLSQLYCKVEQQSEELLELKQKIDSSDEQINFFKEKDDATTEKIDLLQTTIKAKEEEITNTKQRWTVDVEMLNEDLKSYQDSIEELKQEYTESQEQIKQLGQEGDKWKEEVAHLKEALKMKEEANAEELSSTSVKFNELKEQLDHLQSALSERTYENMQLKVKLEEGEKAYHSTTSELDLLKADHQTMTEKIECQRSEISELLTKYNKAEVKVESIAVDRNQAQKRLMELETSLEETRRENEDMREMETRLKAIADKDNEIKNSQEAELDTMKTQISEMCKCFCIPEEEELKFEDLVRCIQTMREENEKLITENAALVGHCNLKQKIKYHASLKHENTGLKKENEVLKLKNRHLEDEMKEIRKMQHVLQDVKQTKLSAIQHKENIVPQHKAFLSGDYTSGSPHYSTVSDKGQKK